MHGNTSVSQVLALMLLSGGAIAHQAPSLYGVVNMTGRIMNAPCTIAVSDLEQTVKFGVGTIGEGKGGPKTPFLIRLKDCSLTSPFLGKGDWSWFQVTFEGQRDGDLFGIEGASGTRFKITEKGGYVVHPGVSRPARILRSDEQVLGYTLQLIGDHRNLKASNYYATVNFKVDYD